MPVNFKINQDSKEDLEKKSINYIAANSGIYKIYDDCNEIINQRVISLGNNTLLHIYKNNKLDVIKNKYFKDWKFYLFVSVNEKWDISFSSIVEDE